ncbi:MAG TPA: hypothetical protein VNZ52_05280 [Candidatus Thermoplasmatota archaeon]|nr:hypothetical protein [Candidatus Thermoplasmatota archaeon]
MEHEATWIQWGVVLGFLALFFAFIFWQARRVRRKWHALGDRLGFEVKAHPHFFGDHTLVGSYAGVPTVLALFERGSGKNRKQFTAIEMAAAEAPKGLYVKVSREGIGDWIAKKFGGQDVQVGDEAFDRAFRIQASDETLCRELLDPVTRQALLEAEKFGQLHVDGHVVQYVVSGYRFKPEFFEAAMPFVAQVSGNLSRLPGATVPPPEEPLA